MVEANQSVWKNKRPHLAFFHFKPFKKRVRDPVCCACGSGRLRTENNHHVTFALLNFLKLLLLAS